MTITTHAAAGIIVAQWTNNPLAGFLVGAFSHFVLDAIPHADEWIYWRHVHNARDAIALIIASIDVLVLSLLMIAVIHFRPDADAGLIAAGVIGGILPDIFITLHTRTREKFREHYPATVFGYLRSLYHRFLQKHYAFHMAFHSVMNTPLRFSTAIFLQTLFLIWFIFWFII